MKKRLSWGAALSLMIIVVAVTVCVTMLVAMRRFNAQVNELSNRQAMYTYISDADNAVRQNYYGVIDEEVLRHAMASGEVAGIGDKYARFLTAAEYADRQEALSGQSTGFGLEVALDEEGCVAVSTVQKGSTAYSAGLQKGDIITALNKEALGSDPLATVQEALDGSMSVILTVRREDKDTAFELSSASFTPETVSGKLLDTTGYIRIRAVNDATPEQLKTVFGSLKEQGVEDLVLDLRGVEGGSPEAAKKVLSFLLPYGLYGYYTDNDGSAELRAEEATLVDVPTAVLVNSHTAGEAELIAAALRQAHIATLVGDTTAGCAMVQQCFPLAADGCAVCITVGEFRLLDKSNWEGDGLAPDVAVSLMAEQEKALELITPDSDAQLRAAIAALTPGQTVPTTTAPSVTTTSVAAVTQATDAADTTAATTAAAE